MRREAKDEGGARAASQGEDQVEGVHWVRWGSSGLGLLSGFGAVERAGWHVRSAVRERDPELPNR